MLRTTERRLAAFEQGLLAVLLLVMMGLSFGQVVLRGVFSAGLLWADTFLRTLVVWAGFLGACLAAADGKQFAMDAAERVIPAKALARLHVVIHVLTAVVSAMLARGAWAFLMDARAQAARPQAAVLFTLAGVAVHDWWFWVILPGGFGLLAVHYLLKAALTAGEAA